MCARFTLSANAAKVAELFNLNLGVELRPRYNVAPTQEVLAVRLAPDGQREFARLRWGLVPTWAKDVKIGYKLINARSETVAEKPSFRSALKHKRRCLIVADGFYEWKAEGKKKQPYLIRQPNGEPFAFAGLWEHWHGQDGKELETCTLLTTEGNARIAPLHDRMPVIFTERSQFERWLTAEDVQPLLRPVSEDALDHAIDCRRLPLTSARCAGSMKRTVSSSSSMTTGNRVYGVWYIPRNECDAPTILPAAETSTDDDGFPF